MTSNGDRPTFVRALQAFQRTLCCLFIIGITGLVATEVVVRSAFTMTLGFAHEISNYLLVAAAFVGFAVALADDKLFRIDLIHGALPEGARRILQLVFDVAALGFSLVVGWYLWKFVMSSFNNDTHSSTSLGVPLYIPQAMMPVGLALLAVTLMVRIGETVMALVRGRGER